MYVCAALGSVSLFRPLSQVTDCRPPSFLIPCLVVQLCDYDIEKSIKRETSLDFKKALLTIGGSLSGGCTYA